MEPAAGFFRRLDDTGIPLLVARLVLAGVFLSMGMSKVLDPVDFLKLIREYRMLPETPPYFLNLTAVLLPWLEVTCAVALLAGVSIRGPAVTLLAMLTVFTGAIVLRSMAIHGAGGVAYCDIKFDCGCGGGEVLICTKLVENVGLILLSGLTALFRSRRFCLSALLARRPTSASATA